MSFPPIILVYEDRAEQRLLGALVKTLVDADTEGKSAINDGCGKLVSVSEAGPTYYCSLHKWHKCPHVAMKDGNVLAVWAR